MCSINDFFSILISMVWHFDVRLRNIYVNVTILSTVACRVFEFFFFSFLFFQYLYFTSFILHKQLALLRNREALLCYILHGKLKGFQMGNSRNQNWIMTQSKEYFFQEKKKKYFSNRSDLYLGIFLIMYFTKENSLPNVYWWRLRLLTNTSIISASMKWLGITLILTN